MSRYIPDTIRIAVAERAEYQCEYCRLPAQYSLFAFHIDHIISLKHGGETDLNNLSYACQICNLNKGTNIATFLDSFDTPVRLFNPRIEPWEEHFEIDIMGEIIPRSSIGRATIKAMNLNHPDGIIERRELIKLGFL